MASPNYYYWQLPNGRIWGCMENKFVSAESMVAAGHEGQPMLSQVADYDDLRERILFYGSGLGELATGDDLVEEFSEGIEAILQTFAGKKYYDTIDRAMGMRTTPTFAADGERALAVYDSVWSLALDLIPQVHDEKISVDRALSKIEALATW